MQRSLNLIEKNNNKNFLYFVTILFQKTQIFLLPLLKFQTLVLVFYLTSQEKGSDEISFFLPVSH